MIEANGIKYSVEIHQKDATKPNLILLHGFMGTGRVFERLCDKLKSFCNPVTIDLLGHGLTDKALTAKRFSTQNQVADLQKIISKMDLSRPFLYGYSMGGRLALQFAVKHPNILSGLILESTNSGLASKKERTKRVQQDEKRAGAIEKDFNAFLGHWGKLSLLQSSISNEKALEHYRNIQKLQNPQQMAMSLRGFGTGRMPPVHLSKIEIPVLLFTGSNDAKYLNIGQKMVQQNPKSKLHIIPDASHRVHLDQPVRVANHLKSFLMS